MKKIAGLALVAMLHAACTKISGFFLPPAANGSFRDQPYFNLNYGTGVTVQFQNIYSARSGDTLFIGAMIGDVAGESATKGFLLWLILPNVHDSSYNFGSKNSELKIYDGMGNMISFSNGLTINFEHTADGNSSGYLTANLLTLLPPPALPIATGDFGNIYLPATGQ